MKTTNNGAALTLTQTKGVNVQSVLSYTLFAIACLALALVLVSMSYAGSDATFSSATSQITDWAQGSLGKALSATAVVVGVVSCVTKFNWQAGAGAIGVGLLTSIGPGIVASMSTAIF